MFYHCLKHSINKAMVDMLLFCIQVLKGNSTGASNDTLLPNNERMSEYRVLRENRFREYRVYYSLHNSLRFYYLEM